MVSSLLLACLPALLCCGGAIHQFPGKGVVPKPMRAEEVQRLKDRAEYEDGRTIDLTTIPFRPQDKVRHPPTDWPCYGLQQLTTCATGWLAGGLGGWVGGWVWSCRLRCCPASSPLPEAASRPSRRPRSSWWSRRDR